MTLINSEDEEVEVVVEASRYNIKIIPMTDVILEVVWSKEHNRLICVARISPEA